jgi:hypothetical protein
MADYLGNQFTSHDLCDENHEQLVEATVQALLASVFLDIEKGFDRTWHLGLLYK